MLHLSYKYPERGYIIAALREWRNVDNEDAISLSRSEVIYLLAEIDHIPR